MHRPVGTTPPVEIGIHETTKAALDLRGARTMKMTRALCLALSLATATAACGNKEEEAKKAADQKADEAAKAAKEADDKAAAAKRDADAQAVKAHAEAKASLQKDIDAADRKATYLRNKSAKLTGAAKKNTDAAVAELDAREAATKADLAKLDTATGTAWDSAKLAVDSDITALNKSVDTLETTLKN